MFLRSREATLLRCSTEKVTSFILRTRSKLELRGLLSHVLEEGLFIAIPQPQARHFNLTVLHATEGIAVAMARVICKGRAENCLVMANTDPKGDIVPLARWWRSRNHHAPNFQQP